MNVNTKLLYLENNYKIIHNIYIQTNINIFNGDKLTIYIFISQI